MSELLVATGEGLVRIAGRRADLLVKRPGLACVAVDPRRPERVVAGGCGSGVWESEDGGATWRDAALPARDVFSVAYGPADGALGLRAERPLRAASRSGVRYVRRDVRTVRVRACLQRVYFRVTRCK